MLHACILMDDPKWDKHLPLAEFSYNNGYQESIKMSPFETLYGWPYRTPLSWSKSGERVIFGPDIVTVAEEKVKQIQANILATQSHQKSYADKRCSPLEFEVGDPIYLQVSPMKGVHRFGIKGTPAPRYISELDQTHICAVVYCTKFQKLKYKNICFQISTLSITPSFCMKVHIIVSSSCKNIHNYLLLRVIPII
jgi:hypothetical protein